MNSFVFEVGDIISNISRTDIRVILELKTNEHDYKYYRFMNLIRDNIKDIIGNSRELPKGEICEQPVNIVNRWFAAIDITRMEYKR